MKTTNKKTSSQAPKKSNKKKWFFLGLGLVATGVLSYFGVQYYKKNKQENSVNNDAPEINTGKPKTAPKSKPKSPPKTAPKAAQKKTAQKPSGSPKNPTPPPAGQTKANTSQIKGLVASVLAKAIHLAVVEKDFKKSIALLQKIKTTKEYSAVSKVFSTFFLAGVRQTLVNGLLTTFKLETQKQALRKAFSAMGLKYNGKKWSLSGIDDKPLLITTGATQVWADSKTSVPVPANMVLGKEVAKRGNHTMFENDKQFFLVESKHVNYYKS